MSEELRNTLLDAVLASLFMTEERKNRNVQEENDFYGSRLRLVDFLADKVEQFFEQDLEDIVSVDAVWNYIQHELKDEIDRILADKEDFVKEHDWSLEKKTNSSLEFLPEWLIPVLHKRFKEHWRKQTLEDAKKYLEKDKGIFVVLLDKDGKVLDEPYPVYHAMDTNVTCVVEEDTVRKGRKNVVARYEPPVIDERHKITAQVLCEVPEDFSKVEVLKFP